MNRRKFLGLAVGTAACAATPVLFADTTTVNDKLDQICWRVGQFTREHDLVPKRIVAINEFGRLVIVAGVNMETDRVFHIADRKLNYTRLGYRVEHRFLDRAAELSVFIRSENECHKFPMVFR